MSEPAVGPDEIALNTTAKTNASVVAAGNLLRNAREATGMHVAALAVSLKVPVKKLEALEAGRIDLLPDLTFARALAASVCRNLKIDPLPVLAHFPATGVSRLGAQLPSINTPYRPTGSGSGSHISLQSQILNPSVWAVAVLLVAAVAVVLWPKPTEAPQNTVTVLIPGTEATETSSVAAPAVTASAPVLAALPVEPVVPLPTAAASEVQAVVLTAQAESWVKVTDAKGVVGVGRTLRTGETVKVTGTFPMAVVVGRADAVQMQVRGQPYDMAAFSKDRVARFEVK